MCYYKNNERRVEIQYKISFLLFKLVAYYIYHKIFGIYSKKIRRGVVNKKLKGESRFITKSYFYYILIWVSNI